MDNAETIWWLVCGQGNDRYRDYLGPLVKYSRPAELLPHIITASDYIKDKHENHNASTNKNRNKNSNVKSVNASNNRSTTKSTVICFRCRAVGHTTKNCTKTPVYYMF